MTDKKISQLTAATTPLAGTEVVPVVQSGVTKKVPISDLTAGRDVSVNKLTAADNLVIGTSGKGIDFSATSDGSGTMTSELLADYEEGTFTPVVADADSGGNTATGSFTGRYTKIGRIVHITIQLNNINTTGMTAGNNLVIRGLPYTAVVTFNQYPCSAYWANLSNSSFISGSVLGGSAIMYMVKSENGVNNSYIKVSAVSSGSCIIGFNATYQV